MGLQLISVMSPAGTTLNEVRASIEAFLRTLEQEDGEVRYEFKVLPMGAGRLWLRPGESDPDAPGVKALEQAVADVRGEPGEVRKFNGGWVDAVELMRTGPDGFSTPALLALDPALTRLATEKADAAQLERLERHLKEQERVLTQPETWSRLDDEFHLMIAEIAGNVPLLLARRPLSAILLPTMWRFVRDERMTRAAFTFHERIVEQMRARDPEAAAFMTRKHINDFRRAWVRAGLDVDMPIGGLD